MKDTIDKRIFEKFPDYLRGIVIAKNVNNRMVSEELFSLMKEQQKLLKEKMADVNLSEYKNIEVWREAFRELNINPNKYTPSVEALVKRVLKDKYIPYINTLVCIFNYISLKYVIPAGGDDLNKVAGDISLTFAEGNELYIPFNSDKPEKVIPGEVIYRDDEKVLCSKWIWRQGDATKITEDTDWVLINLDTFSYNYDNLYDALEEVSMLIKHFCKGDVYIDIISRDKNSVVIA